jgi:hypothetical protein
MKYFTPDLLLRSGSEEDATASAADEKWENACARYNATAAVEASWKFNHDQE